MRYFIFAYPELDDSSYVWLQDIRQVHDKQFTLIDPHFTLVFPTTKLSAKEFIEHINTTKINKEPFSFTLNKAVVTEHIDTKQHEVQLVTGKGTEKLTLLHDLLYTGPLASELRSDVLYVPHITIANHTGKTAMQKLANDINLNGIEIKGRINALTLASFDGVSVKNVKTLPLT